MLGQQGIIQAPQDPMINNLLLTQDYQSLNMLQETNCVDITDYNVNEWIKCRQNPLYFILNYVYFKEYGGKQLYIKEFLHPKLRRVVRIIFRHHMAMLMASRQLGKALSLDTPIPLAGGGYTTMGEIKVGDFILDGNGNPTQVIATTDVMFDHDCYQFEFDNGDVSIIADEDHLWKVSNSACRFDDKIKTTKELYDIQEKIKKWKNPTMCRITLPENINLSPQNDELPIHPYVLGLWLGDGTSSQGCISCHEEDYEEYVVILENLGYAYSDLRYQQGSNCSGTFTIYGLITTLKDNDLLNNKHIPNIYLYASIETRLELLRGLMDSDGYCMDKCGTCQFYQKDMNLLSQVRYLLNSLGLKNRYSSRIIDGEKYNQLTFTTDKYYVFNLQRKHERQDGSGFMRENRNVYLKNISKVKSVPVRCIQVANLDGMFLCGESMIPTHNSSIAAAILSWAIIFYPDNRAVIFNFQKAAAQENLNKVKFVIKNLPAWLRMTVPNASRSEIKTYLELKNGSRLDTFYPSTTTSPDTLSRSLSVPIIYADEVAFIPHMQDIYGAAQPTISKAREQAIKNDYPYFILMTSTPNGVDDTGKFFYEMYDKAVESDNLFIVDSESGIEDWDENVDTTIADSSKNSFIRVRYHWSEDPTKDIAWYERQKKELNFNTRQINQELDLLFVGGTNCIFDDETLQKFIYAPRSSVIDLQNQSKLDLYINEFDIKDYYLVGVDTASSIRGAFNAIEIFSYKNFNQIAEMNVRLGSLTKYGEVVDSLFKWLYKIVGARIILCIENNSIGKAIVEHLLYHVKDFNYLPHVYKDLKKSEIPGQSIDMQDHEYGINTNTRSKELMVSLLYDSLKEYPSRLKSQDLIAQMSSIQRSNRGIIKSSGYSDMFMACCFCAYVRKMTQLQILPLLDFSNAQISQNFFQSIKSAADMMNTKLIIQSDNKNQVSEFITRPKTIQEDEALTQQYQQDTVKQDIIQGEDWRIFMPIFSPFDK